MQFLNWLNQSISSPTVEAELFGWKLDIAYSFGMAGAFFVSIFLGSTPLAFLAPYFDQLVAIAVMIFMLPENMKMLWSTIKDTCKDILEKYNFNPVFFDITRTGRDLWVAVYFEISSDYLYTNDLKKATKVVNQAIEDSFGECTCELILV